MRKLTAILFAALAPVLPVRADWLFWTVDFSETGATESPWTDPTTTPRVWLVASKDPGSPEGGTVIGDVGGNASLALTGGSMGGITAADLKGYDSGAYTFFVEMGAIAGQADYQSKGLSYDSLVSAGFIQIGWENLDNVWNASMTAWAPTGIPEPTSGLLLLIGASLLALKRKRVEGRG